MYVIRVIDLFTGSVMSHGPTHDEDPIVRYYHADLLEYSLIFQES